MASPKPITIGILIFDDVEELDFVGPWEVFGGLFKFSPDMGRAVLIAQKAGPVQCNKGMRVFADYGFEDAPALDVILVPGGQGTRREVNNPRLIEWLRKTGAQCAWVTSVCTGTLLLHEAGFRARQARDHALEFREDAARARRRDRARRAALRPRRQPRHRRGRLRGHRHGALARGAALDPGDRAARAALHPVRPRAALQRGGLKRSAVVAASICRADRARPALSARASVRVL